MTTPDFWVLPTGKRTIVLHGCPVIVDHAIAIEIPVGTDPDLEATLIGAEPSAIHIMASTVKA